LARVPEKVAAVPNGTLWETIPEYVSGIRLVRAMLADAAAPVVDTLSE
jgi:hypothetical protein